MRVVLAITGASGAIYGLRLAEALEKQKEHELHVIISKGARKTAKAEGVKLPKFKQEYEEEEMEAGIASGSARIDAMVICPCSMKTLAAIHAGYADNLVTRCADVMMKEQKKLIIVPRETPLSAIHLRNMYELAKLGVHVVPAMPGFYHKPKSVDEIVDFMVGKVLDCLCVDNKMFKRWGE
ncbi:MAG: flavin prenyltransferase UbiX [Candidatus Micrarchaeota archaeon]